MRTLFKLLFAFLIINNANAQGWVKLSSGTNNSLNSVYFTDPNHGYIVGDYSILKTVNAGSNWTKIDTNCILRSVFFIDSNIGYAIGWVVFKTKNAGLNWIANINIFKGDYQSTCFTNKDTGYMVSTSGILSITEDGGDNWLPYGLYNYTMYLRSVFFTDKKTGFIVGWDGAICKSTDYGFTWKKQMMDTFQFLNCVYFPTHDIGYIAGFDDLGSIILKTIDNGNKWVRQRPGPVVLLNSVYFINADTGFAVGDSGIIIKTVNGGKNWTTQFSGTTYDFKSVFFTDANTGYIVGDSGIILKTNNGGIGINNHLDKYPDFRLYPSHATDKITIEFETNNTLSGINIGIYDIEGHLLINKPLPNQKTELNINNLSKGLYVVKVFNKKYIMISKFLKI